MSLGESVSGSSNRAIEKRGRVRPGRGKIVPRKFGKVAKVLWPENTAANLATHGGADERTGKRWLRGESDPPIEVVIACLVEMFKPID